MTECGLQIDYGSDGWPLCVKLLCICPLIFWESQFVQTLQKLFVSHYKPRSLRVRTDVIMKQKDHIKDLVAQVQVSMSLLEFSGSWKQQNNPAWTKPSKILKMPVLKLLKLDIIRKYVLKDLCSRPSTMSWVTQASYLTKRNESYS